MPTNGGDNNADIVKNLYLGVGLRNAKKVILTATAAGVMGAALLLYYTETTHHCDDWNLAL